MYVRLCQKAPLVTKQLLTPIFLFHLVQSFRFFILFFIFNHFFLLRLTFLTQRNPHYDGKFEIISKHKKTAVLYKAPFFKKIRKKLHKNSQKCIFGKKNGQFLAAFLITNVLT